MNPVRLGDSLEEPARALLERCARAGVLCVEDPPLRAFGAAGQMIRCHYPIVEEPVAA